MDPFKETNNTATLLNQEIMKINNLKKQMAHPSSFLNNYSSTISDIEKQKTLLKHTLKEIEEKYNRERENLKAMKNNSAQLKDEAELKSRLETIKNNKEEADREIERLKSEIDERLSRQQQLQEKILEETNNVNTVMPSKVKEYNYMRGLLNIRFDVSAPANEVKGCIITPKAGEVPFSFNTEINSRHFITNFLWRNLGDPSDFKDCTT